jgi:nucleotide-binding universal stress UspA family protein
MATQQVRRAGPKGPRSTRSGVERSTPKPSDPTGVARPRRPPRSRSKRILLASIGPPIPSEIVDLAVRVATELAADGDRVSFHVLSIARIWGTALGLPNPGLYPNKREIDEQRAIVEAAARSLGSRGFETTTKVISARSASKAIATYAEWLVATAIVVGDPAHAFKTWERWMKGDEAQHVARRTRIPVHTLPIDEALPKGIQRSATAARAGAPSRRRTR